MSKQVRRKRLDHWRRKQARAARFGVRKLILVFGLTISLSLLWAVSPLAIYDFDGQLLKTLFAFRGPVEKPKEVVLVAIDIDSFTRSKSSYRMHLSRKAYAEALLNIHKENPELVIVDAFSVEEEDQEAQSLLEQAIASGPTVIADVHMFAEGNLNPDKPTKKVESAEIFREAAVMAIPMRVLVSNGMVSKFGPGSTTEVPLEKLVPISRPLKEYLKIDIKEPLPWYLINYYGEPLSIEGPGGIPARPLHTFFPGSEDSKGDLPSIQDKIVLIGYTSRLQGSGHATKDQFPVPVSSEQMFGAEILSTIAANLLDGSFIARFAFPDEFVLMFVAFFVVLYIISDFLLIPSLLFTSAVGAVWFAVSYVLFVHYSFFLPGPFFFVVSLLAVLLGQAVLVEIINRMRASQRRELVGEGEAT